MNIKVFFISLSFLLVAAKKAVSQQLKIIGSYKDYRVLTEADSLQKMREIKSVVPGVVYDLRYATKSNFTRKKLYKKGAKTFVRLAVANALREVEEELSVRGYALKIWDAYRPYSVTKEMWELIHDDRYVADPAKGSGHNRGLALDITLLKNGKDVDMGTGFDNFTDSAHHDFKNLPQNVLQSRALLRSTMEKHGFKALETEWWHYSYPNDGRYDVLDLSVKELSGQR